MHLRDRGCIYAPYAPCLSTPLLSAVLVWTQEELERTIETFNILHSVDNIQREKVSHLIHQFYLD